MLSERIYDPIRHLSNALFPFDQKQRVMVMVMDYTGYFDESENTFDKARPDLPRVYTVAGCVGLDSQWIRFQKKWRAVLNRDVLPRWREVYGDKPVFFHMTDFDNPYSKIYADWPKKKKVTFLDQLHAIMATYSLRRFVSCTVMADYEELTAEEQFALGSPHLFGAVNCLKLIRHWADEQKISDRFLYVFESGAGIREKELRRAMNTMTDEQKEAYRVDSVAFMDKRKLSPLQAADILAFETRKEACRQLDSTNTRKMRESIKNLHVPLIDEWAFIDKKDFREIFARPDVKQWLDRADVKAEASKAKQKGLLL